MKDLTKDIIWEWLAYKLPRKLVYFASVRLMVNATCGKYSITEVPKLTATDALKRWEKEG